VRLAVEGVSVAVTPVGGLLEGLTIDDGGRRLRPLHLAPWVGHGTEVPADAAPHLALLEGDFFCAPFGAPDEAGVPFHGWPANGSWTERGVVRAEDGALTARYELVERVRGARVTKEVTLRPGHPVVYQRHVLAGGEGAVPLAHHAMIRVPGGARLSFSRKDFGATPASPQESDPARGRSILAYPRRFDGLGAVPLADGTTRDARAYPFAEGHEDFLTLYDPRDARIGWSAAVAAADGFLFFAVKDAAVLNQTSLWMSNGGRKYAPWSSRHTAVLGIEEGSTYFGDGRVASAGPNAFAQEGYRTAVPLRPDGEVVVRYALGALAAEGWSEVADVRLSAGALSIVDRSGTSRTVPFDDGFLADA
jgi:hypothetical protein